MIRITLLTVLIFSTAFIAQGQIGQQFPLMEAETLTNENIEMPKDLSGKYSLVGLAYSKKAEDHLKTWFEPIYNQFIYKKPNPGIFDFSFDVYTYFVPMFTGAKRPAYRKVMNKMKKTIDERLQPNVVFYKGTLSEYKDALNFDGKDVPYFYVLDPDGKIVYATAGRYTDRKMQEITDKVRDAIDMN